MSAQAGVDIGGPFKVDGVERAGEGGNEAAGPLSAPVNPERAGRRGGAG
jgi:hypothetical protein